MRISSAAPAICFHCGEACLEEHVVADAHDFCCHGCKAVHDLLRDSGLHTYYELEKRPGTKSVANADEARAELFDLPEVREKLVEFSEDGITRVKLHVPQMHCSSCIWLLENLEKLEPAVVRSRVRFGQKELTVNFREGDLKLQDLILLLRRIGYGPQLTAAKGDNKPVGVPRMLYVRLGVAGFCFGNSMLFSFPEYLGADISDAILLKGFSYLNILFSLPVLLFSANGFFSSAFAGIRARRINIDQPIALGIVVLFVRSVFDVLTGVGPGYFDSLAGLVFFLLIGRWYQAYTYQALSFDRTLEDFLPIAVVRLRNGTEEHVGVGDLIQGDRILVRDQELIPVDGILRSGHGHIDNSFITGEPLPIRKNEGEAIRAGGRQRGAAIEVEVLRAFSDSHLKRLWEEHRNVSSERPLMPRTIDAVARRFTVAVLLIALFAGLFWWWYDPSQIWQVVTAVLIVACPCALALSMPFGYGHTIRLLGKRGLFLRDAEVVERMSFIDAVVFDKTGTLTAREAWDMRFTGAPLSEHERSLVRSLARNSTHPLSAVLYSGLKAPLKEVGNVNEIPGQGISGTADGVEVTLGSASLMDAPTFTPEKGEAVVHVALDGRHRGHFIVRKQARAGMGDSVRDVHLGAATYLVTGDLTVDPEVAAMFTPEHTVTGCTPAEKAKFVKQLQKEGRRVMMVGDGLNDAGALLQSDVGVTVSESSAALTPASDAIVDASALHALPRMLRLTRSAHRIVIASLILSLLYNVTGVSFAVSGHLTPLVAAILMPLSSVSVVGFVSLAVWWVARREGLVSHT